METTAVVENQALLPDPSVLRQRVFILENDPEMRLIFAIAFSDPYCFEVYTATDGMGIVALLGSVLPDILIVDIHGSKSPEAKPDFSYHLNRGATPSALPVVVITGNPFLYRDRVLTAARVILVNSADITELVIVAHRLSRRYKGTLPKLSSP